MNRSVRTSITAAEFSLRSILIARYSRLNSSITLSMRNFLPSWIRLLTKS